jgi:ABC-type antimicrobial peptide transport system permease subunit
MEVLTLIGNIFCVAIGIVALLTGLMATIIVICDLKNNYMCFDKDLLAIIIAIIGLFSIGTLFVLKPTYKIKFINNRDVHVSEVKVVVVDKTK